MNAREALLQQAARYRRLANAINDPVTAAKLQALAADEEARAAELRDPGSSTEDKTRVGRRRSAIRSLPFGIRPLPVHLAQRPG
jgi:hypothetical protein